MAKRSNKVECSRCGACCKLFIVDLTKQEYLSGKYDTMIKEPTDNFKQADMAGANILAQKDDKSCIYLENNTCTIYNKRPKTCREFSCSSKKNKYTELRKIIKEHKKDK
ncbi:MAG: YkgJ family cysteine cluster protein [Nanoarchaeota archaeon]|nr:YkgJ family cysteine cluster protein [Nanoarchaeota archaeon]MBU1946305.1 YkgJ family cysteine cluster protein [Nanoarchaeota archaeon]